MRKIDTAKKKAENELSKFKLSFALAFGHIGGEAVALLSCYIQIFPEVLLICQIAFMPLEP